MSVDFSTYISCLDTGAAHHREALESCYQEAARSMSPRGLENYLEGMRAMCVLGRNADLVMTYVQEMPGVAREVGEDVIPDVVGAAMKLASHTSGSVIILLLSHLPLAASRLGDADVLRGFLSLVHQVSAKAPRGLRPMLQNLEELLGKLTLGGLRRWAMWGIQAHQRDLAGQIAYFGLQTETARAVLQKERRGTLFVDQQRKLNFYLRALWGRSFFMRPTAGDYETRQGLRPYIEEHQLHLPDAFDVFHGIAGSDTYRATAAHCAAHIVFTREPLSAEQLSVAQMRMIELFEDARVELLAIQRFPGLHRLFAGYLDAAVVRHAGSLHPLVECMLRTARRILVRDGEAESEAIEAVVDGFLAAFAATPGSNRIAWMAGMDFHNRIAAGMPMPGVREFDAWPPPYRDDNRFLWAFTAADRFDGDVDYMPAHRGQLRRRVSAVEMANEVDCELAGDDAQEIWVCSTELFPYEDEGVSYNEMWGREPVSDPHHYPEWDYQAQLFRPDWTTVLERRQGRADPAAIEDIVDRYKPIASRLKYIIDALQPQGIVRRRGYEEGEELDLDAAVRAMVDIRRGVMPDTRINVRITRHLRDLAVLLLLDLSESTNDPVDAADADGGTVLDLTRDAAALMSWAMGAIGDPFAVHGFASDGRHDVHYYRFKDFEQPWDDNARSRLAGMKGGLSTRMGAALRHAGWHLGQQSCSRRLVLLVTDGEPADIDERDPQYLRHDARKAVEDLAARGVYTYCITLDPAADRYVARIFGENNYSIVDRVERLPERLPAAFAALTG